MHRVSSYYLCRFMTALLLADAVLCLSGCRPAASPAPDGSCWAVGEMAMVRTELYFGLSRPGGEDIPTVQFDEFVQQVVTPRFPDGLTIVDGTGQWRDRLGNIAREKSKILIILHAPGARAARAIEEIRSQYQSRFAQESVMRVDAAARVAF